MEDNESEFYKSQPRPESLPDPIEIPVEKLDPEILTRIIEEFVLREGTDYGTNEVPLPTKIEHVRKQLKRGDVRIFFEPESESVTLVRTKTTL